MDASRRSARGKSWIAVLSLVAAVAAVFVGIPATSVEAQGAVTLAPPADLTAGIYRTGTSTRVEWSRVVGADHYQVRGVDDGEEFYRVTTTRTIDSDAFAAGEPNGQRWGRLCYYVKAVARSGDESPESEACFDAVEPEWLSTPSVDATVDGDKLVLTYSPVDGHAHVLWGFVNGRSLNTISSRGSRVEPSYEVDLNGQTGRVCGTLRLRKGSDQSRFGFDCVETGPVPTTSWSSALECEADGTRTITASMSVPVGQKLGGHTIFRSAPGAETSIQHGKASYYRSSDDLREVDAILEGVPPGRWTFDVRTYFGLRLSPVTFEVDACGSSPSSTSWGSLSGCDANGNRSLTAMVTNNSDLDTDFRIVMLDAETGAETHGSHGQRVRSGQTGPVSLGGIPPGNWNFRVAAGDQYALPATTLVSQSCTNSGPVVWGTDMSDCDANNNRSLRASVTNRSGSTANYRLVMLDPQTNQAVHGSHDHPIRNQATAFVTLGGIPEGRWLFKITENGNDYGPPRTLTRDACPEVQSPCIGDHTQLSPQPRDYVDQVSRGNSLDLDLVEANLDSYNGNENHVVLQSLFDPVVADKDIIFDEYFVIVRPGTNLDSESERQAFLADLATDMDDVIGGDFAEIANFTNQGSVPEVGQVIDIDVNGNTYIDVAFVNAPVVITHIEPNCFGVKTIEYNGDEHILHGDRRFGYEVLSDTSILIYTRAVSIPDRFYSQALAGERNFWGAWLDGVERYVVAGGGEVNPGGRRNYQRTGHGGPSFWLQLSDQLRAEIKAAQIDGHRREAERLDSELEQAREDGANIETRDNLRAARDEHLREMADWEDR